MSEQLATTNPDLRTDGLVHEALFYSGTQEYLAGIVPFVLAGLDADEPVLVAVPGGNLDLVTAALGPASRRVRLADMSVAGRNPGRIIGGVLSTFVNVHAGRRVRVVGEPMWAGRTTTEYTACVQHEALVNLAFVGRRITILCPYDARRLPPAALLDAERTHPALNIGSQRVSSLAYQNPEQLVEGCNVPLPEPGRDVDVDVLIFDSAVGTHGVRRFLHERAERAGMRPDRIADLRCAVQEVVLNTLVHTSRPGILSTWVEDDQLVCEVQDSGSIADPLVGRRLPDSCDGYGAGLFLVNGLCDLVLSYRSGAGTTTRMYLGIAGPSV
jgi:anti-sigma regulatory factor (Ser/Thr protein kinase)